MSANLVDGIAELAELLRAWGKPGAIVGGIAFVARVRPRFTDDLDLLLTVPVGERAALLELAAKRGFVFSAEDRTFFNEAGLLPMKSPLGFDVDLMIADDVLLESAVTRATPVEIGGVTVPVVSVEDLLLMKLDANRHVDLDDAIAIKDALGDTLDRAYLVAMARRLDLLGRLESLLGPVQ